MRALLLFAFALTLASCTVIDPPPSWVTLDDRPGRDFAAVSAQGSRLTVRRHKNPTGGTLAFWVAAIKEELVDGRGYSLLESIDVRTDSGRAGTELLLGTDRELKPHLYLLAVFVDAKKVTLVEAGGEEATLRPELPALRASVRSLR